MNEKCAKKLLVVLGVGGLLMLRFAPSFGMKSDSLSQVLAEVANSVESLTIKLKGTSEGNQNFPHIQRLYNDYLPQMMKLSDQKNKIYDAKDVSSVLKLAQEGAKSSNKIIDFCDKSLKLSVDAQLKEQLKTMRNDAQKLKDQFIKIGSDLTEVYANLPKLLQNILAENPDILRWFKGLPKSTNPFDDRGPKLADQQSQILEYEQQQNDVNEMLNKIVPYKNILTEEISQNSVLVKGVDLIQMVRDYINASRGIAEDASTKLEKQFLAGDPNKQEAQELFIRYQIAMLLKNQAKIALSVARLFSKPAELQTIKNLKTEIFLLSRAFEKNSSQFYKLIQKVGAGEQWRNNLSNEIIGLQNELSSWITEISADNFEDILEYISDYLVNLDSKLEIANQNNFWERSAVLALDSAAAIDMYVRSNPSLDRKQISKVFRVINNILLFAKKWSSKIKLPGSELANKLNVLLDVPAHLKKAPYSSPTSSK